MSPPLALSLFTFAIIVGGIVPTATAQDLNAVRDDQINRLRNYVVDALLPSGLVRDSLVLDPNGISFHPATPDAAGFALIALSALDHLNKLPDAEQRVVNILSAYAGQRPGLNPDRSADGHFIHFMNINTGAPAGGGWDDSYSPISTALLVAGAQFARNHFAENTTIASLTQQLTDSVDFNAAIDPSLSGRIFLDMTKGGGGAGSTVRPWNEFMLVHSLALREADNQRALAVKHLWQDVDFISKRFFQGTPTLTDSGSFAPAFWVHQMHFFNGDFRHSLEFEAYFVNQQIADQRYSSTFVGEEFRYGVTAGVIPNGYHADKLFDHPFFVFSPEAVAVWGDMETLLEYYAGQIPNSDPRYRYGLVRESAEQPNWVPFDAGLVDHLFLLFGLVESLDANFFVGRVFAPLAPGEYNADGAVNTADYNLWRSTFGSTNRLAADGNRSGVIDAADYVIWRKNFNSAGSSAAMIAVPEPNTAACAILLGIVVLGRRIPARAESRMQKTRLSRTITINGATKIPGNANV